MPVYTPRQQFITKLAKDNGYVMIDRLAEELAITTQTVRRDINYLCEQGVLSRFHGGGAFRSSVENIPYEARRGTLSQEKERIAIAVAKQIDDNSSIFIDIGTTAEAVAHQLNDKHGLRIVTNNINVITLLSGKLDFDLTIVGGTIRHRDLAVVGAASGDFISKFEVDYSILGVVGIGPKGDIFDFSADEEGLTQAIIGSGRKTFLVADHSKFGRPATAKVAHIKQLDTIFTDRRPDKQWIKLFEEHRVKLVVA